MSIQSRCSIYDIRPNFCRDYPFPDSVLQPGCTFSFIDTPEGKLRQGSCQPTACGVQSCCNVPREDGEPQGSVTGSPDETPCKHLSWEWSTRFPPMDVLVAGNLPNEVVALNSISGGVMWGIGFTPAGVAMLNGLEPGEERAWMSPAGPVHMLRRPKGGGTIIKQMAGKRQHHGLLSDIERMRICR